MEVVPYSQLVPEEIYNYGGVIIKYPSGEGIDVGFKIYTKYKNLTFCNTVREASKEQKKHLNLCILLDKYVDYNLNSFCELGNILKQKYPIGSTFLDLVSNKEFKVKSHDFSFYFGSDSIYVPVETCKYTNCTARIYSNNEFAKTVKSSSFINAPKEKTEFKEGDYIVTLDMEKDDGFYNCAKRNYCFKQKVDNKDIFPVTDLKGSNVNGHSILSFDKKGDLLDWRYATQEEIEAYDYIGRPYDTSQLILGKFFRGEYVVSLTDVNNSRKIGEVFKVLDKSNVNSLYYSEISCSNKKLVWRRATLEEIKNHLSIVKTNNIKDTSDPIVSSPGIDFIAKAKQLFPIGSKVSNKNLGINCTFVVTGNDFYKLVNDIIIRHNSTNKGFSYTVYCNKLKQWAELIENVSSLPESNISIEMSEKGITSTITDIISVDIPMHKKKKNNRINY